MNYSTKKLMLLNNKLNQFNTINFAKEIDLYNSDVYKELKCNLIALIKNKYLNYNNDIDLNFYTHINYFNKSYETITISCSHFMGNKLVTIFELKYSKYDDKFELNYLFKKMFDFDFVKGAISDNYDKFVLNVFKLEKMFKEEYTKFYNQERKFYQWYFKTYKKIEIQNEEFNEKVNKYIIEHNINQKLVKQLQKIITINNTSFCYKVSFFREYNFKNKKLKNSIDYGFVITITNNDGLYLIITYSVPLNFVEISKINLISGSSFMKKNTPFKNFLKKELINNLHLNLTKEF